MEEEEESNPGLYFYSRRYSTVLCCRYDKAGPVELTKTIGPAFFDGVSRNGTPDTDYLGR